MNELARLLIISGVFLVIAGVVALLFSQVTGLPKMPGDIFIKKGNFTFYFPWVTSIIISIILTIIINFFLRK